MDVLHPAGAGAGGASGKGGKGRVAFDAEVILLQGRLLLASSFSPVHLTTQSSGHLATWPPVFSLAMGCYPRRSGTGRQGAGRLRRRGLLLLTCTPDHPVIWSPGHLAACLQFGNGLLPQEIWDWIRNLGGGGGATSMGETRGTLVTP